MIFIGVCAVTCWDEGDAATVGCAAQPAFNPVLSHTWAGRSVLTSAKLLLQLLGTAVSPRRAQPLLLCAQLLVTSSLSKSHIIRTYPAVSFICWKTVCSKGKVGWQLSRSHCVHTPAEGGNPDVADAVIAVSGNRNCTVIYDDLMFLLISSEDQKARDDLWY